MPDRLPYFPHDQLFGASPDADLAADVSELAAFFSEEGQFLLSDLRNDLEIGGDEYADVDAHNCISDEVVHGASVTTQNRASILGDAYPFSIDDSGSSISYSGAETWAQYGYLLCLVLSHLEAISPVLAEADLEPSAGDQARLRDWFQKIAAPALAAELNGRAWAFGDIRSDRSPFLTKLKDIWTTIGDGSVKHRPPPGASPSVKDDGIDVIAARPNPDGDPGFPIALAQVATGRNWTSKSIRLTVDRVFFQVWFDVHPASQVTCFHVVPFVVPSEVMYRRTLELGHILHRLRFVLLLKEAQSSVEGGLIQSEGTEVFDMLGTWFTEYNAGEWSRAR